MNFELNNWMKDIDGETKLFTLSIPGTHDSVTQHVQFSKATKCQDLDILGQLNIGVRALDLRVKSEDDRLKMVHAFAKAFNTGNHFGSQMDMANVLDLCYRFLEKNPSETIIIQFKNDNNKENEKCFDLLYKKYICKNKSKWYLKAKVPTIDEARGKIVLVRRCKMDLNSPDYSVEECGIDFSNWVEQDEITPYALPLETKSEDNAVFYILDRFKYKPEPRWDECIKPFLDERTEFDGNYVICYLSTAGGVKGPEQNAKHINQMFMEYPLDKNKHYGIFYVDFPNEELTSKIISHNF